MKTIQTLCRFAKPALAAAVIALTFSSCKRTRDEGPAVNNNLFSTVAIASTGGTFESPKSAVPDATGQWMYFIASDANGIGVFKSPVTGGDATEVFVGAPFSQPIDIALSTDNKTIYVADQSASGGAILSLSIGGSTPVVVPGTAGTMPNSLDVILRSDRDHIYFCGTNAGDGQKAVFESVSGIGGLPSIRYKGAPLQSPAGIVSAKDGTLYVADGNGMVFRLSTSNEITTLAGGIIMGSPAGIALTPDETILAVSSKNPYNGTAQVEAINLVTGEVTVFNKVIGANSNPGGLHGARDTSGAIGRYGWADVTRSGRVYRVEP